MTIQIRTIPLTAVNCYLLTGEKTILIDAGVPGLMKLFLRKLANFGVQPEEIDLVIITHAHADHTGMAMKIKELTGAKIAIHQRDKVWLESGKMPIPRGATVLGKIASSFLKLIPKITVPPALADIVLEDENYLLNDYGIPGKIVYTPGHTMGSVSVLLDTGEAFVGDLAMSARFMRFRPGYSIFADDIELIQQSVKKLLGLGMKTIYPAHGRPFSADVFRRKLA
jgi:hydroxyacylglutathione hydrolase